MPVSFTFQVGIPLPRTAQELQDRIKLLFEIRTELDREIETMMGVKTEAAKPYHCVRCDYQWKSRLAHRPKMCPRCRIKKFDRPPLYTYEEKIARKQELLASKQGLLARARAIEELPTTPLDIVIPPVAPMAHSVLTRQVSSEADSIQNVMLTPPPEPDRPLSLRERLAQMKSQPAPEPKEIPPYTAPGVKEAIQGLFESDPTAVGLTEEDLMGAINGEDDIT